MQAKPVKEKKAGSTILKELVGKWFFILYAIVYAGFILINVASPSFMGINVGSYNVAIIFGFGLILFAILLAFAYNHICSRAEQLLDKENQDAQTGSREELL
jgi:uncharacterized membrane protein (DUF485 family)